MNDLRAQRHRTIADLIRANAFASQEELARLLAARGYSVTQATISRDLEQIGAVKLRREGRTAYALPDQVTAASGPRLSALFRDFVRSTRPAGNLLVIKTPPGSAHLIGVAIDQAELPEIVGTICGDDTLFVACETPAAAQNLDRKLNARTPELQAS